MSAVLDVPCPRCDAPASAPCVAVTPKWQGIGEPVTVAHLARVQRARGQTCTSTTVIDTVAKLEAQRLTKEGGGASSLPALVEAPPLQARHLPARGEMIPLGVVRGYEHVRVLDHPAALRLGYQSVALHRVILWHKIGPGPHACYWCERSIDWGGPADSAIQVDHVDWNKLNNDPTNLQPSCRVCNLLRSPPKAMRKILKARGWM